MNRSYQKCNMEQVSRFYDSELTPDEYAQTEAHIAECSVCKKMLADMRMISNRFSAGIEDELHRSGMEINANKIRLAGFETTNFWMKVKDILMSRRFLAPVSAIVTMIVVVGFSLYYRPAPIIGPSAIVNSFTGEISSVMILETPKSRQTIIWFNETF